MVDRARAETRRISGYDIVEDGLMTVQEAAQFLSISRGSLYNLMTTGELPFAKVGRSRRIPRRAVIDLAARSLQGGVRR
jgi:excisionase family DNA binding protein